MRLNHLQGQTSPYLLQHVENPVDWYPWCEEAFARAKREDKPIFLSIGYSTCHWCHVMAHESFEDEQVAKILNEYYISIKVDKEERPDIDSIYMEVCQAFTGSGGWPTTVLMTPDQKPFFAGTYFPRQARMGQMGLMELLSAIAKQWETNRQLLLDSAEEMLAFLQKQKSDLSMGCEGHRTLTQTQQAEQLIDRAVKSYKRRFDEQWGGFGRPPKFPMAHNLLFLMRYYQRSGDEEVLSIVDKTLEQMYRGGLFDHIGGGFCRYSTDRFYLVPHFEKMLYDNALLIHAYAKAYQVTKKDIYREIAERTAGYVLREMRSVEGGFYSAQDADSEGEEGKYYLFTPAEITSVLGKAEGKAFNAVYDITEQGNFEGKNIPNLLRADNTWVKHLENDLLHETPSGIRTEDVWTKCLKKVYEYRRIRYKLHTDDKILTAWNALMIAAMAYLYRVTQKEFYLDAAIRAQEFLEEKLCEGEALYVSYRDGWRGGRGFLDDYSYEIYALLALYGGTWNQSYLRRAEGLCEMVLKEFSDVKQGGFFLNGEENEQLLLRPKQASDGAVFSGNSVMAYNLLQLHYLTGKECYQSQAKRQLAYLCGEAEDFPTGYAFALVACLEELYMPDKIVVVCKEGSTAGISPCQAPLDTVVRILEAPTEEYPLHNDRTTYYVCKGYSCLPPTNEIEDLL